MTILTITVYWVPAATNDLKQKQKPFYPYFTDMGKLRLKSYVNLFKIAKPVSRRDTMFWEIQVIKEQVFLFLA